MAYQIRVNPESLRAAGQRIGSIADVAGESTNLLNGGRSELVSSWEGSSSVSVLNRMDEIINGAKDITEAIQELGQSAESVAQVFEAADENSGGIVISAMNIDQILTKFKMPFSSIADIIADILRVFDHIRIIPERVYEVGQNCQKIADTYRENASELDNILDGLRSEWEGKAFQRFDSRMKELLSGIRGFADNLDEFASSIISAAQRFEELDQMLAQ